MTRISLKEQKQKKNQKYHQLHYIKTSKQSKKIAIKKKNAKLYTSKKDTIKKRYRLNNPRKAIKTQKETNQKYYKKCKMFKYIR